MTTRKTHTAETLRDTLDDAKRLLDDTRPKLNEAITRAQQDSDGGYKPTSQGPSVSGSEPSDLFQRAYVKLGKGDNARWVARSDHVADTLSALITNLVQASINAAAAYEAATELCALDPEEARRLLEQTESKSCTNCSRPVAGTRADPFRSGRCFDCYRYRLSHGGKERPRELWVR